ncbi:MAG: MATE family efflux transporter [Lachnospiraceae bacterium]|jgi:putative MATE family efflux protein|nr:MATE family efflux transporter [Lachnospiraceae bacterium]
MRLVTDKQFYKSTLLLTIPLALQNLVTFTTNMLDTFMVGRADNTGVMISAINLANQPFFVLIMFIFGIAGAGNVLASQYWGKQNIPAIKTIFAIILKLAVGVTAVFALAVLLFPQGVMRLYTKDSPTIAIGAEYLQIVGFSYLIYAVSATFIFSLRSVEVVRFSVVTQLATLFISAGLNYLLIFGNGGFPRLEHRGAAISTLTARTVELLLVLGFLFFIDKRVKFRPRDVLLWNKQLFVDLARFGAPVVINEVMWALGISVQAAILGHIAYAAGNPVAANTVAGIVQQFATIVMFGIANAAQVLIGKSVGEGDIAAVKLKAATFKLIALVAGLLACGVVLLLRSVVPYIYDFGAATNALAGELLLVTAVSLIFVSFAATYIVGILRGAGDTRFCLIAEMFALWGFSLPLAALFAVVFHLPVPLVLLAMRSDEFLKAVVCTFRCRGERWIKAVAREAVG